GPAGLWGGFIAFYLGEAFGTGGAWLAVVLLASALTAWTLRWNPVRAIVGPGPSRGKATTEPTLASLLEPSPEEMPAIDGGRRETGDGRRRGKRGEGAESAESPAEVVAAATGAARKKGSKGGGETPSAVEEPAAPAPSVVPEADAL